MMPHANTTVRECPGDLWQFYAVGEVIAIPTNGIVKSNGDAIMGAGLAKDAASRFPDLPKWLGDRLKQFGNVPVYFRTLRLITLPTKHDWKDLSSLTLICDSINYCARHILRPEGIPRVYCSHLGCGHGGLHWQTVRDAIATHVDDRFIFVAPPIQE